MELNLISSNIVSFSFIHEHFTRCISKEYKKSIKINFDFSFNF